MKTNYFPNAVWDSFFNNVHDKHLKVTLQHHASVTNTIKTLPPIIYWKSTNYKTPYQTAKENQGKRKLTFTDVFDNFEIKITINKIISHIEGRGEEI